MVRRLQQAFDAIAHATETFDLKTSLGSSSVISDQSLSPIALSFFGASTPKSEGGSAQSIEPRCERSGQGPQFDCLYVIRSYSVPSMLTCNSMKCFCARCWLRLSDTHESSLLLVLLTLLLQT